MENAIHTKLVGIALTLVVGIILVGSVLVPVISDASHTGAEEIHNGAYLGKMINDEDANMIVTNAHQIVVDGVMISDYNYSAIMTDTFCLRINAASTNVFWTDGTTGHWSALNGANIAIDGGSKTITMSDIVHSSSNDNISGDTLTVAYNDYCFVRDGSGPYATMDYSQLSTTNKVNDANQVYAANYTANHYYSWNGDVALVDGADSESGSITLGNVSGSEVLYTINDISNGAVSALWVVIPAVVYGESDLNSGAISLLWAIPAVILISFLLVAVKAFRKED